MRTTTSVDSRGWKRLELLVLLLGALLGAEGCGQGGLVGGECRVGLVQCDQSCVDISRDVSHCGGCGQECGFGQQCVVGVCVRGIVADSGLDGGTTPPDGAVIPPTGGSGGSFGGGGSGPGGSGGDGSGGDSGGNGFEDCIPPLNSPNNCGVCGRVCEGDTPYCAPSGGSYACVAACSGDDTLCGAQCVDLLTDVDHCGSCGARCPTAICESGTCIGATAGHEVLMCMNLASGASFSAQTKVFENSVFLAAGDTVRVLGYTEHTSSTTAAGVRRAATWADSLNGRELDLVETDSSADVTSRLSPGQTDVLLIYDQDVAPPGALGNIGAALRESVSRFLASGGIVIVTASAEGAGEMSDLISAMGLAGAVTGQTEATNSIVHNRAPSDAVGLGVFDRFRTLQSSCFFNAPATPPAGVTYVVTSLPEGDPGGLGAPVVIHSVVTD